ncbi:MAG: integrase core domain-containing protein [Rhodobacteraceae bacterium]|nr:integrase core domain-containing protein [Paracoccaceae bacterium]
MQVFGLPASFTGKHSVSSRALSSDPGVRRRVDPVRRRRRAMSDGLGSEAAARAVGVPRATLYRWMKSPELLPTRLRRAQPREAVRQRIRDPRRGFPARGKISAILRREGHGISGATVGRLIRAMVRSGSIAPVSAFTGHSGRRRRVRRPHAVRVNAPLRAGVPGGAVQTDTLHAYICPGKRVRHFTAIDRISRWSTAMAASSATASSAARFPGKLIRDAPFEVTAVQVDGGSEFMAGSGAACRDRGIKPAVLPPKSPEMNGRVERMQATWRNEFHNVQDTAVNITELNPMIERHLRIHNSWRPHDALDGLTPNQYPGPQRIKEDRRSHM